MPAKKGNRVQIAAYLDELAFGQLAGLSRETRVPVAAYVREAIDDLLIKYGVIKAPRPVRAKPKAPK